MKHNKLVITLLFILTLTSISFAQECDSWIKSYYQQNTIYNGFLATDDSKIYEAKSSTVGGVTTIVCKDDQLNILHEAPIKINKFVSMQFFMDGLLVLSQNNGLTLYYFSKDLTLINQSTLTNTSSIKPSLAVGSNYIYLAVGSTVQCYNNQFVKQWEQVINNHNTLEAFQATANDDLYFFGDEETLEITKYSYIKLTSTGQLTRIKSFTTRGGKTRGDAFRTTIIDTSGNLFLNCNRFKGYDYPLINPLVKIKTDGSETVLTSKNSDFDLYYDKFRDKIISCIVNTQQVFPLWSDISAEGVETKHFAAPSSTSTMIYITNYVIATPKNLFIFGYASNLYFNAMSFYGKSFAMKLTNDYCFFSPSQEYYLSDQSLTCLNEITIGINKNLLPIVSNPKKSFSELSYTWTSPDLGTGYQKKALPLTDTTYYVTITAGSCSIQDSLKVTVKIRTDFNFEVNDYVITAAPIYPLNYYYTWEFSEGMSFSNVTHPTYTYQRPGTFSLCLKDRDNEECSSCVDLKVPGNYSGTSIQYTGIPENEVFPMINLYPNPSIGNKLNIGLGDEPQNWDIKIYDITGQFIFSRSYKMQSHIDIDISQLKKGLYLINLKSSEKEKSVKFMRL